MSRALLVLSITVASCTSHFADPGSGCLVPTDGIVLVAWTVRGQTPDTTSCAGIDHLALAVQPDQCTGATIEPIPCAAGRIRYDNLPRGSALVSLDAFDARNARLLGGVTRFDVEPNPAAPPAAIDLR